MVFWARQINTSNRWAKVCTRVLAGSHSEQKHHSSNWAIEQLSKHMKWYTHWASADKWAASKNRVCIEQLNYNVQTRFYRQHCTGLSKSKLWVGKGDIKNVEHEWQGNSWSGMSATTLSKTVTILVFDESEVFSYLWQSAGSKAFRETVCGHFCKWTDIGELDASAGHLMQP